MQLFETVNFAFMQKIHLLVKKHRKVNFVIFHRGFTSSNFAQKKKMLQKGVLLNDIVKSKNRANCTLILSNFWHQIRAWNIIDYFRLIWNNSGNIIENWLMGHFFHSVFVTKLNFHIRIGKFWKSKIFEIHLSFNLK